jgi:hypothetical protein
VYVHWNTIGIQRWQNGYAPLEVEESMWMKDRGIAVRLPAGARGFSFYHRVQTGPGIRIRWLGWGFTPEGKAARNKTDNSYLVSTLSMHVAIS